MVINKKILQGKEKYEGKVFRTVNYGDLLILEYRKSNEILVEFLNTKTKVIASINSIMEGKVKDRFAPSVFGVGVVGNDAVVKDGRVLKEYVRWQAMLERCYNENNRDKRQAYEGCTVSENFKYFPYFKEWYNAQVGHNIKGWDLDKDILSNGGKVYSEDTCVFIPFEINRCISDKAFSNKNDLPSGVKEHGGDGLKYYSASIYEFGESRYIGNYDTILEAKNAYCAERIKHIHKLAEKWKDQIDPRAYEALSRFS